MLFGETIAIITIIVFKSILNVCLIVKLHHNYNEL